MGASAEQAVHVVIPTHTTRWLAECLAGLVGQRRRPSSVTLTCDVDDPEIEAVASAWAPRLGSPFHLVMREHTGEARLNQVRNNGLRALLERRAPADADGVVVLDGDTVLEPSAIEKHASLLHAAPESNVVIPFRVDMTEEATELVSLEEIARGEEALPVTDAQRAALATRQRRYERQRLLRRFGLAKGHKPKIIGGHHVVRVGAMLGVNGYDEEYVGYGYDDDDLARRLYAREPAKRPVIAISGPQAPLAFHLWHPTRAGDGPTSTPGYARFRRGDLPVQTARGVDGPLEQPEVRIREWNVG